MPEAGLTIATIAGPTIDWAALSPLLALFGGAVCTLLVGLIDARSVQKALVPLLTLAVLTAAFGLSIWQWGTNSTIIAGALRIDSFTLVLTFIFLAAGAAAVLLSLRENAVRTAGAGEYFTLLLTVIGGMVVLVAAQNLVTLFVGIEVLSIPLYVLCATRIRQAQSLEAGLKYLIIGSVGSATLLYGLALVYGVSGSTDFDGIRTAISSTHTFNDPLLLVGIAFIIVGLAFKASSAPFHQWTPDVYEGAPTPITAFMAVATKVAALGIFLRFFDQALLGAQANWAPLLAGVAALTIVVGNVGALGQDSLKRMMAYSGVGQVGYMLVGIVVASQLGVQAMVFYLVVYLFLNIATFAVIVARERQSDHGDSIASLVGIGKTHPELAWPMTISMLALAGFPATAGFIGKIYLIDAAITGHYTWLAIMIVIGSMISLGYYLRVVATMWMTTPNTASTDDSSVTTSGTPSTVAVNSSSKTLRKGRWQLDLLLPTLLFAGATIFFGIIPTPLFKLAIAAGKALSGLF